MPSSSSRGFTLIELMVVIVILSGALLMVMPRLGGNLMGLTRLRAEADRLAAAIAYARDKAGGVRNGLKLEVDFSHHSWKVIPADETVTDAGELPCSAPSANVTVRQVCLLGSRRVLDNGTALVRFTPDGWVDPAVIELASSDGDISSVVVADPTGRVEIFRGRVELSEDGKVKTLE